MMPTSNDFFFCVWDNEIISVKCLEHSWHIVGVDKCQLLLLLFIITIITTTSTMTRYPSLQLISHISVGSYLFLFRLPCRAPPTTSLSVDSSTAPDRALSSHWSPAPGQPIAGHFRSSSSIIYLLGWHSLVRVSSSIWFMFPPSQPFIIITCQPDTALATHYMRRLASLLAHWALGDLLICLEPNVYFTQLGGLLPMSLEGNGNWGTWNGERFSVFLLTVHNKLKWLEC